MFLCHCGGFVLVSVCCCVCCDLLWGGQHPPQSDVRDKDVIENIKMKSMINYIIKKN